MLGVPQLTLYEECLEMTTERLIIRKRDSLVGVCLNAFLRSAITCVVSIRLPCLSVAGDGRNCIRSGVFLGVDERHRHRDMKWLFLFYPRQHLRGNRLIVSVGGWVI